MPATACVLAITCLTAGWKMLARSKGQCVLSLVQATCQLCFAEASLCMHQVLKAHPDMS
jgi:hypothetical protein